MKKQFTFLTLLLLLGASKIFAQCVLTVTTSVTSNYSGAQISCNGLTDGAATAQASGQVGALSYTWSAGNQSTPTATALGAGIYTVNVEDLGVPGCIVTSTIQLVQPAALTQTITTNNISCLGLSNGSATVSLSGGTSPYSFAWSTGASSSTITGLAAGAYTHTLTDANNCISVSSANINQPASILVPQSSITTSISCNGQSAVVTVTATGGNAPYSGTGSFTVSAGPKTYTVTDNNGCSLTTSVNVIEPSAISASSSITSSVLCNGGNAVVTVTATGGTGSLSGLGDYTVTAGVQTFTVTDNNSCAVTTTVNVTEPSALLASSSFTNLCGSSTASVVVSATGGTGSYSGTGTFTAIAGAYTYTVSDANSCSNTTTITVTTNTAVSTFSTGMTAASCFGKADATAWVNPVISLPAETPFTYSWTPGAANTRTITNIAGGVYTVNISAANGCAYTRTVDVKQPAVLMLDMLVSPSTTICPATTTTLSISGAATYTWSTGSNNPKIVVTPTVTTNYSVTGTSFLGCTVMSSVTIVTSTTTCLGVSELDNSSVLVYPNPASENINVQLSSQLSDASFVVIDALGKVVMIQKMESVFNLVNISTLNSGVYFYQIKLGSRILATQKFIKE